ncbi:nitric oxide-associated protein 1-like [Tubulanus polymorphus]|uniref:nitric oxide-associated protein 1-like n=1 Tax=Tubulanus polymorphus TaxID=672921 RepID=UPI003DA51626
MSQIHRMLSFCVGRNLICRTRLYPSVSKFNHQGFSNRRKSRKKISMKPERQESLPVIAEIQFNQYKDSQNPLRDKDMDDIEVDLKAIDKKLETLKLLHESRQRNVARELQEKLPQVLQKVNDAMKKSEDDMPVITKTMTREESEDRYLDRYGSADPSVPFSNIPCSGCGAILHCQDPHYPGYLASEKFLPIADDEKLLKKQICQRCFALNEYNLALNVAVKPRAYVEIVQQIKNLKTLILFIVDMTDLPNSVIKNLTDIIGENHTVFVVGNKVDLLPNDGKHFFERLKETLCQSCADAGLNHDKIEHVALLSAKTGYGVEELINKMISLWEKKGDVYVIGSTNVGKSTLFNSLLGSDYCSSSARDLLHRATTSVWPGTTLSLLKFPIFSYNKFDLYKRGMRLKNQRQSAHAEAKERMEHKILPQQRQGRFGRILSGKVETTYDSRRRVKKGTFGDHLTSSDLISYKMNSESELEESIYDIDDLRDDSYLLPYEFMEERYPWSKWCYDTPGLVNHEQVINYLTPDELSHLVTGTNLLTPKTFRLKPKMVLLVGGLGRIEYLDGESNIYLTVFSPLPTKCAYNMVQADDIYRKASRNGDFKIPCADPGRLLWLPSLVGKEFTIIGKHWKESAADIVLSSAGWVSVTPGPSQSIRIRAYTPGSLGLSVRTPSMLPYAVNFRGKRITKTPEFEIIK